MKNGKDVRKVLTTKPNKVATSSLRMHFSLAMNYSFQIKQREK